MIGAGRLIQVAVEGEVCPLKNEGGVLVGGVVEWWRRRRRRRRRGGVSVSSGCGMPGWVIGRVMMLRGRYINCLAFICEAEMGERERYYDMEAVSRVFEAEL